MNNHAIILDHRANYPFLKIHIFIEDRSILYWTAIYEFHCEVLRQFVYMGVYTLSAKPRWACAMCGMYSSRKYSVRRHINNLHDGIGNIVSFIDYVAGRRQGVYFPNPIPSYMTKQIQQTAPNPRPVDIMKDEFFRTALRKSFRYP